MKTYGTIKRKGNVWKIECEPHVMMRLKRVFRRVAGNARKTASIPATPELSFELRWFCDRFPMKVEGDELEQLAGQYQDSLDRIDRILEDPNYVPPEFDLEVPARLYQRQAAALLLERGSLLLADDVGLGKTASAICAFTDPSALPALVVTLTHLPRQWESELRKFAPRLSTHIVKKGTPYKLQGRGLFQANEIPDVLIINYHKLAGWGEALAGKVRTVVFDEVQELRRSESNKYAAACDIAHPAKYRIGLSATPVYNYGGEIYSILEALSPGALGTKGEFSAEWCTWGEKMPIVNPRAFGTYLRDQGIMLRRTREDVGRELPEISIISHHIEADLDALADLGKSLKDLCETILAQGGSPRLKMEAAGELDWKMRQCTGIAKAPYVAEFVRLLVESGERVVLFGWHREVYSIWLEKLSDLAPALYSGSESPNQKQAARDRFVNGETPVLIMSLRSGAGLDGLQGCCRVVVFGELDWSPGVHEQCIGRIHRDGQEDRVAAYYLVSNAGADPVMADVLGVKRAQSEGIRDPKKSVFESAKTDSSHIKRLAESILGKKDASRGGGVDVARATAS